MIHRILFVDPGAALEDALRHVHLARALMRQGFAVEVLIGSAADREGGGTLAARLAKMGMDVQAAGGSALSTHAEGACWDEPPHFRLEIHGVPLRVHDGRDTKPHDGDRDRRGDLLNLLQAACDRFQPDAIVLTERDPVSGGLLATARERGIATVLDIHDFSYRYVPSDDADAILVPSRCAAAYYPEAFGLECIVLPHPVAREWVVAERSEPKYLTFVNPSFEKGVYAFARIADELGRRRPDIPILVVESRGTEETVAGCGLDLRVHGNVFFMPNTHDPREFWGVSRVCLMPSLWWESQGLVAVEAMTNGIPVVASDRGALPETLGEAGIVLPLPQWLTPATRLLPTAEEVAPWVEAIMRLWDDRAFYEEHQRRSLAEARRWAPEVLEPQYVQFFNDLKPGSGPPLAKPLKRSKAVVLVPHLSGIEWECERGLRELEAAGVKVARREGSSAIDVARNMMASEALQEGYESLMFIDADIGFNPLDALRLIARPEPVVAGVYAKKGLREMSSKFLDEITEIVFGANAAGLYPLKYAATGFLRIRSDVLRKMIDELDLPLCNARWGRGFWPFFQPIVVPDGDGGWHYLGEDWAFSHRLKQIGITPLADTSIRLWHYGRYSFGWEDAGADVARYHSYVYRVHENTHRESVAGPRQALEHSQDA